MRQRFRGAIGVGALVVAGLIGGCVPDPEGAATDTIDITSVSLVITDIATATDETPLPTPSPFVFPPTLEPTSICDGAPPTRLILGERARVDDEDKTDVNVRPEPGATEDNPPIGKVRVGEVVLVLDGPVCSDRYAWYRVNTGDLEGWIAEGDTEMYYVEPFLGH